MLSSEPTPQPSATDAVVRPRVLFVCKGSEADGLGHVMRTRAVATAMNHKAHVEVVAIGGETVRNLLADSGLVHTVVSRSDMATRVSTRFEPDVVVFDLLKLTDAEFEALAGAARTVSLSPIFDRMARVDLVFHRTDVADPSWDSFGGNRPRFRMGLDYAVIDRDCSRITARVYRETLARKRLSVAISMGGADAANKTLRVMNALMESRSRLLLWVLLGEGYRHSYQDLVDCARGSRHEIILAKTNESMWHILGTCGLCVLAGGTTTYQAGYAGLPSVNILESPDRRFLIQELVDKGVALSAGDDLSGSLSELTELVAHLDANRDELARMHKRAARLIDGNGASRIVDEVLALSSLGPDAR